MIISRYENTGIFSNLGQKNSNPIKNLINQRQSLLERKNELINSTLENGGDVTSIQDLLNFYEEQLKDLDQQISQEALKQNRDQMDKTQSSKGDDKPKTKQEIEQERIFDLVDLSSGISQTKTIQSAQTRIEGEARVLESEIKMDKGRTGDTQVTARKEEKLLQLQEKSGKLTEKAAEISGEIAEKIKEEKPEQALDESYKETYKGKDLLDIYI